MKNFDRSDLSFSLCGLNCALCTMKLDGYCPGCGGGAGNQGCSIARCSMEHGDPQYCFECSDYPCGRYIGITKYDSFMTHRNQLSDMEKVKTIGLTSYHAELREKANALNFLLENYNDGRRKTFFCLAVNLLELTDLQNIMKKIEVGISQDMPQKAQALVAVKCFEEVAEQKGVVLKLNKMGAIPNSV